MTRRHRLRFRRPWTAVPRAFRALRVAPPGLRFVVVAILALGLWAAGNWVYHAVRKPTELLFPVLMPVRDASISRWTTCEWNYAEKSMLNRSYSPEFRVLMEYEASQAHHYYKRAEAALAGLSSSERRALTVAEIMRGIYSRILERIERSDYQVFGPRISLTTTQRVMIALGVWLRSRFS